MPINQLTFTQFAEMMATQYGTQATAPANTNIGSSLGAIFNAVALLALNVQNELIYVQDVSRLLTSTGSDIDSFVNAFGVYRITATYAADTVTLSTSAPVSAQLPIPVGGLLATAGGLQFTVVADPNNVTGFFNAALNAYVIPTGDSTANVLVQCTTTGILGNVIAGAISTVYNTATSPIITGIATVSNASAFTNGQPAETDAALQARFMQLMSTGIVATDNALAAAVQSVQPGLTYALADGYNASAVPQVGVVTIVVNVANQSQAPSTELLQEVLAAINNVRPAGIQVFVIGPNIVDVNVVANVHVLPNFNITTVLTGVTGAVQNYLNSIGLSPTGPTGGLTPAELSEVYVVMRTFPGVGNVTGLTLNGSASDVIPTNFLEQLVAGTVTLTPF